SDTKVVKARQGDQRTPQLEPGKPLERGLAGGEAHHYQIKLVAGQFLEAVVDQRGIDVMVRLFGPDNQQLIEVDSPTGMHCAEVALLIAEVSGNYRLEISSDPTAKPGRYQAKITARDSATEQDRHRVKAQAAFIQA